jgi:hypothetical protein
VCNPGVSGEDCSQLLQEVLPMELCVVKHQNNTATAIFSYLNKNDVPVTIPVGDGNKITPGAADRGQPTTFLPGSDVPKFEVLFDVGSSVTFTLGRRSVTINADSCACKGAQTGRSLLSRLLM